MMRHVVEESGFGKYLQRYHMRKMVIVGLLMPALLAFQFIASEPEKQPPLWLIPAIMVPMILVLVVAIYNTNRILRKFIGTEYILSDTTLTIKQHFQVVKQIPIETIEAIRIRPEGLYVITGKAHQPFNTYGPKRSLRHLQYANTTLIPTCTTGFAELVQGIRKSRRKKS